VEGGFSCPFSSHNQRQPLAKQFLQPNLVGTLGNFCASSPRTGSFEAENHGKHGYGGPFGRGGDAAANQSSGIRLAIDDFGTGYSSLSYLHRFPLDTLKIDRSFISSMGDDGEGMEIARTILPMANNLRLDVVAEGVETLQQVAMLKKLHCNLARDFTFPNRCPPRDRDIIGRRLDVASVRANHQVARKNSVHGEQEQSSPLNCSPEASTVELQRLGCTLQIFC